MPTWAPRARLRPAFSASRLILLILFWLWGFGGIFGAVAFVMWTGGSVSTEGVGATDFGPFIEFGAVIWLGGLILLGVSALTCGKYWIEEQHDREAEQSALNQGVDQGQEPSRPAMMRDWDR